MLTSLLRDADEDEERMRMLLCDGLHTSYLAYVDQQRVGAVTMRWQEQESEIEYVAVLPHYRGHGYGRALIAAVLGLAQQRGVARVLVGTDTTSFDNIAFYQKCGFRIHAVRHDFFSYIQPPISHNGIPLRDMLVLSYSFS